MADNVVLDPGSGGSTIRTKDRTAVETQIVALDLNPAGSEQLMATAALADATTNPTTVPWAGMLMCFNGTTWDRIRGDTTSGMWANVKASALPTGAATAAKQPALGTAGSASADVLTVQGIASMTALKVDGSAVTQPVSGTVTATGPLTDTQLRASAVPVSLASAPSTAVTNAGTFAVQIAANSSVNNAQVSGTAVSVNSGAKDAGTQRVILASDQTVVPISDNSGSLTVDAPVGTPVFSTPTPSTTGGWSKATALAQTTTKKAVKASAGTLGGYYAYNPNASVAYIQVFDVASGSVTLGSTAPDLVFGIPAGSAANLEFTNGVNMATAITLACTTTATGSTAPSTGLDLTIVYK
jgi:hypothetical protein